MGAFGYADDYAHAFFMDNKAWSDSESYYAEGLGDMEGARLTSKHRLGGLGLSEGRRFLYIFDFGEEPRFHCRVLRGLAEKNR